MNADSKPAAESLEATERKWKIIATKADIARTVVISIIGTAIAAIFYVYQDNETQSRYYTELQSQRERADTDLRSRMFDTLFQNYFKAKLESSAQASRRNASAHELSSAQLDDLRQEIVLSDLLARNFEAVDVRPLFEDIDRRLTERIDDGREGQEAISNQIKAFRLREQLRRVARGATSRQTESLIALAKARSQQVQIEQCESGAGTRAEPSPNLLPALPGHDLIGVIERVAQSSVRIVFASSTASPVALPTPGLAPRPRGIRINVTHYDMPALENVRMPNGERIALTLTRFISAATCERFFTELDETNQADCSPLIADAKNRGRFCNRADIALTILPADYIGVRDRPFLNELSSRNAANK